MRRLLQTFFIKEDLSFEQVSKNICQAFESTSIMISTKDAKDVVFHVLYRPPNLSKLQFLDEFGMFLEGAALSGCENILLGDLNFQLDQHNTRTLKFYDYPQAIYFDTTCQYTYTYSGSHFGCSMCEGFLLLGHLTQGYWGTIIPPGNHVEPYFPCQRIL